LLFAATVLSGSALAQSQSSSVAATDAAPQASADAAPAMATDAAAPAAAAAAAPAPEQVLAPATAAQPAAPPASATFSQKVSEAIGTPKPGKALVVFFRPSKFAGGAIKFKVRENEVALGQLGSGKFFALQVEPGPHTYVVHSEAKDVSNAEFEAGETYFIVASISMGFMAGHPNLSPSDATAFEAALGKMRKVQMAE
jgi:hypothetical protein